MTKIITAPNPTLSQVAQLFNFEKETLASLLKRMEDALLSAKDPKGVGLAAPQINESVAVFITKPNDKSKIKVFINPTIIDAKSPDKEKNVKKNKVKKLEGCLSLPSIWGEVSRSPEVTLSYQNEKGTPVTRKFTGFMATIVQHEVDHLNGVLFPKRVLEQKGQLYKSSKNEKGEDEFEEITI